MVQIARAALCLAAACCATVTSASNATTDSIIPLIITPSPVPAASAVPTPPTNTSAPSKPKAGIESAGNSQCEIEFTFWDHDYMPRFDINFVHSQGTDHTTELFHDQWVKPRFTSNNENIDGQLSLVQIWPGELMVCISAIKLSCGANASGYGAFKTVTITADALQESWIRKTNGDRKPVDWAQGPCMYFRSAPWDGGAFRALDISRRAFECGEDYRCVAGCIETFGN